MLSMEPTSIDVTTLGLAKALDLSLPAPHLGVENSCYRC